MMTKFMLIHKVKIDLFITKLFIFSQRIIWVLEMVYSACHPHLNVHFMTFIAASAPLQCIAVNICSFRSCIQHFFSADNLLFSFLVLTTTQCRGKQICKFPDAALLHKQIRMLGLGKNCLLKHPKEPFTQGYSCQKLSSVIHEKPCSWNRGQDLLTLYHRSRKFAGLLEIWTEVSADTYAIIQLFAINLGGTAS